MGVIKDARAAWTCNLERTIAADGVREGDAAQRVLLAQLSAIFRCSEHITRCYPVQKLLWLHMEASKSREVFDHHFGGHPPLPRLSHLV